MITSIFLNFLYLVFPLLCYFIYMVYSKASLKKENLLFFDLALFSSYYICSKFGNTSFFYNFLIYILILLGLHKKRYITSILFTYFTSVFISNTYGINLYICLLIYLIMFVFGFLTKVKTKEILILFKIIFDLVIVFVVKNDILNISNFWNVFLSWIIIYFVFYIVLLLFSKLENIVNMYHSLESIMKEKTLYESLFKITHEIKNPLAVCKGYLDMFDIRNTSKANKYVSIINQEIDRTLELLKDFSDISKSINIDKHLMDVTMLIEDVCDEASLIFDNNIKFEYQIKDEEIFINGDYNRLKQVLINVVKNAKEAIEGKGLVSLNTKIKKGYYIITIIDNGVGMDKETKKKIGTAFYTTKKNGTGLGVCFSKEIIEKHKGIINYFSIKERGTTVKISLPINKTSLN